MLQCRRFLLILLSFELAAAPLFAQIPAAATASPTASSEQEVLETVERGRQALLAENPSSASSEFEHVLRMPAFGELDPSLQMQVFQLAAIAASAREDYLGAHEFMRLATEFPHAEAQAWLLRAIYAGAIDDWDDAGFAYAAVAKRWPEFIRTADSRQIALTAIRMNQDGRHSAERVDLLSALFAADFKLEYGVEPANLWRDLAQDALEHHDLTRAREISVHITDPATLVEMRIDRRFDALTTTNQATFDVRAAAEREYRRLKAVSAENPRALSPLVQQTYSMLETGRTKEIVRIADDVIARVAKAPAGAPAYVDIDQKLNWIYDNKFRALRALGRWDEALAVLEAGSRGLEGGSPNVNQAINLGDYLLVLGRPGQALGALDTIDWGRSLNGYGRMQMQHVRYRAFLQLGNAIEAEKVLAYLREHRSDAEDTWQVAVLESGDLDGAAVHLISRLHDPETRTAALASVQDFASKPRTATEKAEDRNWSALLARADVTAAIDEVGRREKFSIYRISD